MEIMLIALLFVAGILIGVLASLFGIGGAIVAIPVFRILLGFSGTEAVGTAITLTIPTAIAGALQFSKQGLIKYKTALIGGIAGIVFSIIGAMLTQYIAGSWLMALLGILILVLAAMTFLEREKNTETMGDTESAEGELNKKIINTTAIGASAGFASGFFGIGGGALLVPLLTKMRGISIKKAVPTSLMMIAIYAIPSSMTHYALGNVNLSVAGVVLVGAMTGAWIGAGHSARIDEKKQRTMMAALLAIVGTLLILNEVAQSTGLIAQGP
ncbi:MAG: sulfite exporter TauE/SafE family protein [Candidatus Micrarchaeota archaeon]